MAINGLAIGSICAGTLLCYSAIHGKSVLATAQSIVQGKSPGSTGDVNPITLPDLSSADSNLNQGIGAATGSANQQLAQQLATQTGHSNWNTGQQWSDWVALWQRESDWEETADTRVTHAGGDNANSSVFAYGIPQARPYTKYPKAGWPPDKGGTSDAGTQISWGIQYISGTYGNPSQALDHENTEGWY